MTAINRVTATAMGKPVRRAQVSNSDDDSDGNTMTRTEGPHTEACMARMTRMTRTDSGNFIVHQWSDSGRMTA